MDIDKWFFERMIEKNPFAAALFAIERCNENEQKKLKQIFKKKIKKMYK
ncbi:hypothetical protein MFS40622_1111 [Methanocaldococcus sp. FS406-22]|nr:hypothetical protein [Methanocaldococcus sp. FS406-22]ADC69791.1 hypothetical protein MFS40622_1111 [Methanocaldococcus sp. FS406-22]